MNRVVRKAYPVSKLPDDLRVGFAEERPVSIVIEQEEETIGSPNQSNDAATQKISGGDFSRFKHLRRANFASSAEVDDYLRALRDEWARRER